jgi:hypothetical protein
MQQLARTNVRWFRPAMAGLMAVLVLVLTLFASSEKLHLAVHQDADTSHHLPCAVCSFAQGQLEMPVMVASEVAAPLSVSWTLPAFKTVAAPDADFSVASSRGPPVSVSSL